MARREDFVERSTEPLAQEPTGIRNDKKSSQWVGGEDAAPLSGIWFSPHRDGSVATSVGVVNNGIERLIHPLPEHHSWGLPEGTKIQFLLLPFLQCLPSPSS